MCASTLSHAQARVIALAISRQKLTQLVILLQNYIPQLQRCGHDECHSIERNVRCIENVWDRNSVSRWCVNHTYLWSNQWRQPTWTYVYRYSYAWYLVMRWIFLLVSECLSNLRVSVLFLMHSLQAVMNLITVICFWSNNYMIVVYRFCRKWSKSTLYIALTCLMSEAPHYIHTHVHQTSMHKIKASFIHIPLPSQMLYFTNIE